MNTNELKYEIEQAFSKIICSDFTREFEKRIRELVIDRNYNIENLEKSLRSILDEENQYKYHAFYALNILYRRNHNIYLLGELIKKYEEEFKDKKSMDFLIVLYEKLNNIEDPISIIEKTYDLTNKIPDNSGVEHCFAESVAFAYENNNEYRKEIKEKWLETAFNKLEKALKTDKNYGKFYCTRARLKAIKFDLSDDDKEIDSLFKSCINDINSAIDKEDSKSIDYMLRLSTYQQVTANIQRKYSEKLLQKRVDTYVQDMLESKKELQQKIDGTTFKNLEFLGFFAALVSFLIGSIQIISNQTFDNALKLIIVLMISLIIAFSFFGLILREIEKKRCWLIVLISIILLTTLFLIMMI